MCNLCKIEVTHDDCHNFTHEVTLRRGVSRKAISKALDEAVADKSELVAWSTTSDFVRLVFRRETYRG